MLLKNAEQDTHKLVSIPFVGLNVHNDQTHTQLCSVLINYMSLLKN